MLKKKSLLVSIMLGVVLIFSMIGSPVFAASITLSDTDVLVGSTVNINGSGFTQGAVYQIKFGANALVVKSGTVFLGGTVNDYFIVPEYFHGSVVVTVQTSTETASATLSVMSNITADIKTGNSGQNVTINGTGFAASQTITITFDNSVIHSTSSNENGSFDTVITVPENLRGNHIVKVADADGNFDSFNYFINTALSVSPASGIVGSELTINGTGFADNKSITITDEGVEITAVPASVISSAVGSFTAVYKISDNTGGQHQLFASDGTNQAIVNYVTLPNLVLDRVSATVGDEIFITGTGFQSQKQISISLGSTGIKSIASDTKGGFKTKFNVPSILGGSYQVIASDGEHSASVSLSVGAVLELNKTSGAVGQEIAIDGVGFSGLIIVKLDDIEVTRKTAVSDGKFSATFVVPAIKAGNHLITASDGSNSATVNFTITASAEIDASTGWIGMQVELNASGFVDALTIKFDDIQITTLQLETTETITTTIDIPVSKSGSHVISVNDAYSKVEIPFIIESIAPAVPELLLPTDGKTVSARPNFDWTDVTDPGGVSYTFEIASNPSFTNESIIIQKDKLAESKYQPDKTEALPPNVNDTSYYWRVKAIDNASNASSWTTPLSFRVTSGLPVWVYALIGLGVILLCAIGFIYRKKFVKQKLVRKK
jgi:hypothetical protein